MADAAENNSAASRCAAHRREVLHSRLLNLAAKRNSGTSSATYPVIPSAVPNNVPMPHCLANGNLSYLQYRDFSRDLPRPNAEQAWLPRLIRVESTAVRSEDGGIAGGSRITLEEHFEMKWTLRRFLFLRGLSKNDDCHKVSGYQTARVMKLVVAR
jgi:hypothetical protein